MNHPQTEFRVLSLLFPKQTFGAAEKMGHRKKHISKRNASVNWKLPKSSIDYLLGHLQLDMERPLRSLWTGKKATNHSKNIFS